VTGTVSIGAVVDSLDGHGTVSVTTDCNGVVVDDGHGIVTVTVWSETEDEVNGSGIDAVMPAQKDDDSMMLLWDVCVFGPGWKNIVVEVLELMLVLLLRATLRLTGPKLLDWPTVS
jgi:hypothetical protein